MKPSIVSLFSYFLLITGLLSAASDSFAQNRVGREGGRIEVQGTRDETNVVVRSDSAEALSLLRSAFTVHGGYAIVSTMQEASFGIKIDPVGSGGARLTITSGVPETTMHTETVAGQSSREALLKAIDRAVFKTSGLRGFFAGKLAFVGEETGISEIYTSDMLFGNIVKLTSDNVDAVRPHWSPDGNYIVYTSYQSGFPDIHRLDLRSNRREVIVDFKGTNMGARYSPDGTRLAMIITGGKNADVWLRESNGALRNLTKSDGLEAAPAWSPDGSRLVFSSDQSGGVQLFVVPSSGGGMRRLRTDISGYCAEPDWNPVDPNKISFTAAMGNGYQIAVFDTQEGKSRFVTSEQGDAIESHWLNDGRHLVYTVRRANTRQIKILDTVTGRSYLLSGSRRNVSQPGFLAPR